MSIEGGHVGGGGAGDCSARLPPVTSANPQSPVTCLSFLPALLPLLPQILAGKLKPNLGRFESPPDWEEILGYFRGSELQNYFTKVLEDDLKVRGLGGGLGWEVVKGRGGRVWGCRTTAPWRWRMTSR